MSPTGTNKFTAAPAALGYLHQCRYALFLLLERSHSNDDAQIAIEKFDDISFEKNGTPEELIQVKHHLGSPPDLSDTSSDLWTTLRVWSDAVSNGLISLPDTILSIVTTAQCAPNSAAMYLKVGPTRSANEAHKLLLAALSKMKGKTLQPAREAFKSLGNKKQKALLSSVHIIDNSGNINNIKADIRKALGFPVSASRIEAFRERLEGWWFSQVIERLSGLNNKPISAIELGRAMDDLRDSFRVDSLPIDFRTSHPPLGAVADNRPFVEQLRLIKLDDKNINWARVDFYRAYAQRSRWLKDNLLVTQQLSDYDTTLTEQWARERDWREKEAKTGEPDSAITRRGLELYEYLQRSCPPIRTNCTEPYVGRGSYHLLADRKQVGWHRDYMTLLTSTPKGTGKAKK